MMIDKEINHSEGTNLVKRRLLPDLDSLLMIKIIFINNKSESTRL
jgi:hypothetical protein